MSDATSALALARFDGLVTVEDKGLQGMITLRGDMADSVFADAVTQVSGTDMPGQRRIVQAATCGLGWMSPDELLLLCPYADAEAEAAKLQSALAGQHALVANVSDARACLQLTGTDVREVIAKLAPVDMAPDAFAVGEIRRTRFAQAAAAFWLVDDQTAQIVCFRSVAQYMFDLLKTAADPDARVGFF